MEEHAINYLYRLVYTFRDTAKCKTFPFKIFNQKCRMVTRISFKALHSKDMLMLMMLNGEKRVLKTTLAGAFFFF